MSYVMRRGKGRTMGEQGLKLARNNGLRGDDRTMTGHSETTPEPSAP
jgi:hypothetical protein